MIINYFGVQLQIIDNGDGTFDIKPIDSVADRAAIRDEIRRLKDARDVAISKRDRATEQRDAAIIARDEALALRTDAVTEIQDSTARIQELRDFLVAAGDPDPGT